MTGDFSFRQNSIRQKVLVLLKKYPRSRDNDTLLVQLFHFHIDDLHEFIPFEVIKKLTTPETIVRARRHIQNRLKLFRPSKERQRGRRRQEQEYRKHYGEQV